jgi:hypothetical protein
LPERANVETIGLETRGRPAVVIQTFSDGSVLIGVVRVENVARPKEMISGYTVADPT